MGYPRAVESQIPIRSRIEGPRYDEAFDGHLAAAERELGAFVLAVCELYGSIAASCAADYWLALVADMEPELVEERKNWRLITIRAASLFAKQHSGKSDPEVIAKDRQAIYRNACELSAADLRTASE